jgi:hypothetical protein
MYDDRTHDWLDWLVAPSTGSDLAGTIAIAVAAFLTFGIAPLLF